MLDGPGQLRQQIAGHHTGLSQIRPDALPGRAVEVDAAHSGIEGGRALGQQARNGPGQNVTRCRLRRVRG